MENFLTENCKTIKNGIDFLILNSDEDLKEAFKNQFQTVVSLENCVHAKYIACFNSNYKEIFKIVCQREIADSDIYFNMDESVCNIGLFN